MYKINKPIKNDNEIILTGHTNPSSDMSISW